MNTLFMRLEGYLQSWGERGRWTVRDSALYPTKSGVVGLLGAALGVNDDRLVSLSQRLLMGVRVDKPGVLVRDYHTVTSGVIMADGKLKGGKDDPQTVVSHRFYLAGASFLVALQGHEETIEMLSVALQAPQWFLSLGRTCCIPSAPIYAGVGNFPGLRSALKKEGEYCYEFEGGNMLRMDEIASVEHRSFKPRGVERLILTV